MLPSSFSFSVPIFNSTGGNVVADMDGDFRLEHGEAFPLGRNSSVYRELKGRGVPVVRIGSHVVHGYSPEAVMAYYNGGK